MKQFKKVLAILLTVLMIVSAAPLSAFAADPATGKIIVESKSVLSGDTVEVNVVIQDNPGILGATLAFSYDKSLTLVAASAGEAFGALVMTRPGKFTSPCQFVWDGESLSPEDIKDGVILTLTFAVSDEAVVGSDLAVNISYRNGDIVDANLRPLTVEVVSGKLSVIDYIPGDVNGDGIVNSTDVILMRRHIAGGYDQSINALAADVNADGIVNSTDVILLRRYIAGGYEVCLLPGLPVCNHILNATEAKAATCKEEGNKAYWQCSICKKYFSDAEGLLEISADSVSLPKIGHTPVEDPAVPATYTSTGLTEGFHCAVCLEVIVAQEVTPMLEKTQYSIQYNIAGNDAYLGTIDIANSNPQAYSPEDGLILDPLSVPGYIFEGWFDGEGASAVQVKEIAKGTTGNIRLYAKWSVEEYKVQFDSPMAPMSSVTYTVKTGVPLNNPTMDGYTFVGWTDDDCNLMSSIPVGMTGDITLHANWTSKRNQTRPNDYSKETPAIYLDEENGIYMFAYNIGTIENVPLYTIETFPNMVKGLEISRTVSSSKSIVDSTSDTIANMVSNATTQSNAWSLSSDWSENVVVSESHASEVTQEEIDTAQKKYEETGKWDISKEHGGSFSLTDTTTIEQGISAKLNGKVYDEINAGVNVTIPIEGIPLGVEAGNKFGFELGLEVGYDLKGSFSEELAQSKTWNTKEGFSQSSTASMSQENSQRLAQTLNNTYGKNYSTSTGGSENTTKSTAETSSNSREYASSFAYSVDNTSVVADTYTFKSESEGYYRLVCAGTLDVYAVVIFDVKESAYSVYTYSLLQEEMNSEGEYEVKTNVFMDFSKNTPNFNDYENGVLPFEVPTFVRDYVDDALLATNGLVVDIETGKIVDFDTSTIEGYATNGALVAIPEFIRVDNGDGTFSAVKVTGFESDVFAGKNIRAVALNDSITEIPDGAFAGCENLEVINCPSVKTIGDDAFNGCTSLKSFTVSSNVTSVGTNAFNGVKELIVNAAAPSVVLAGVESGAKRITISVASMSGELKDVKLVVPETTDYFEFQGANTIFHGISIESDAATTVINGAAFTECTTIPLKLSSENVLLNRVSVEAPGYAMVLTADSTSVGLYGTISLTTAGENAVLCKDISLSRSASNVTGKMNVLGNFLICGSITGGNYLTVSDGEIIYLTQQEYENMLHSYSLFFELDGGACDVSSKEVANGTPVGVLPVPEKPYYTFAGWFLADGTTEVTSDYVFSSGADQTIYAHWQENPLSDWVKATEVPDDAQVINTKYTYTLRAYTTNSKDKLDGWEKYDTKRTGWGTTQGPVYSDPSNGSRNVWPESYVVSSNYKTIYHYYRWASQNNDSGGDSSNSKYGDCIYYREIALDYELSSGVNEYGTTFYKYYYNGVNYKWYFKCSPYTTQQWVSDNYGTRWYYQEPVYTYYFYQDQQKESTSYPTGSDISNIVEWVQYRAK